jgi:hypothetical protein
MLNWGDKSIQSFYVVESGEFDVFLDGNHIHSIPKGGCFGDLKLTDEPAQATCRVIYYYIFSTKRTTLNCSKVLRTLIAERLRVWICIWQFSFFQTKSYHGWLLFEKGSYFGVFKLVKEQFTFCFLLFRQTKIL